MIQMTSNTIYVDKGWERIVNDMNISNQLHAEIGFPSPSPQHQELDRSMEGEMKQSGLNMASLALVMEKGSPSRHIPPRPFMQQTFDSNKTEIRNMLGQALKLIHAGKLKPKNALAAIGLWYAGRMKEKFVTGDFAANTPLTKLLKGSSQPLIDLGNLRKSVKSVVRDGKA